MIAYRQQFAIFALALSWLASASADVKQAARQAAAATMQVQYSSERPKVQGIWWPNRNQNLVDNQQGQQLQQLEGVMKTLRLQARQVGSPQLNIASATVVSPDGLLVAFCDDPPKDEIEVQQPGRKKLIGKVAVRDERTNLCLIKIDEKLAALDLAEQPPEVGDTVVGAGWTGSSVGIAAGIVGGLDVAVVPELPYLLQTDVALGAAAAGGPLVNDEGKLLGILVARPTESRLAYAIPVTYVKALLNARRGEETVTLRPALLGIRLRSGDDEGAIVEEAFADSPAAKAGLKEGDVIVSIAGKPCHTGADIVQAVRKHLVGDEIEIRLRRDDKEQTVKVVLAKLERPAEEQDEEGKTTPPKPAIRSRQPRNASEAVKKAIEEKLKVEIEPMIVDGRVHLGERVIIAEPNTAIRLEVPQIRVSRTDSDLRVNKLDTDIQSIRDELKQLREEIQRLNESLRKKPESMSKD